MANEIYMKDEFALEVIAHGSTIDDDAGFLGRTYTIETWVVRFNHIALNAWLASQPIDVSEWEWHADSREEAEEMDREHEILRAELIENVKKALGIEPYGITITQNVTEIFTVVNIRKNK